MMACVNLVDATSASVPSGVCSANMVLFSMIVDNLFANTNILGKKRELLFGFVDKVEETPPNLPLSGEEQDGADSYSLP